MRKQSNIPFLLFVCIYKKKKLKKKTEKREKSDALNASIN